MPKQPSHPRGRGAFGNTAQRFSEFQMDYDEGEAPARVRTKFYFDHSSSVISRNSSPDLPFEASLNPYRGCEHGCAYCYARPTHEYLGWSAGMDFESRIMVKKDAPALLRREFARPGYKPVKIALSGVTDCYQPAEKKLRITRQCIEVLAECRHPVSIVTKNHLVLRDLDLLAELARHQAVVVMLSVTTLDPDLAHRLEPRASAPRQRIEAIRELAAAGIPAGIMTAPIIPGLNDSEIPALLDAAAAAGAQFAGYTVARLPFSVKEVFAAWLDEHMPGSRDKILGRIEDTQGRTLSHADFGKRLRGEGVWADQIAALFRVSVKRAGIPQKRAELSATSFRRPLTDQGVIDFDTAAT
ncbi:MAG: PA0069 family radical SAM protein [Verrucomicrobiaceae bacterium]|nr:PA0069 family radical SAM protein [Verrucomicrobiaceae bacterium]